MVGNKKYNPHFFQPDLIKGDTNKKSYIFNFVTDVIPNTNISNTGGRYVRTMYDIMTKVLSVLFIPARSRRKQATVE